MNSVDIVALLLSVLPAITLIVGICIGYLWGYAKREVDETRQSIAAAAKRMGIKP